MMRLIVYYCIIGSTQNELAGTYHFIYINLH